MSDYPWLQLAVYVVTVGVVQLLALWAATSQLPWLVRALVVWVPIALLLPIRAYEPALLLTMSATWTIFLEIGFQQVEARRREKTPVVRRWRFRLADLFVLILLVCTLLGTALHLVEKRHVLSVIHFTLIVAAPIAAITLLAYRAVVGPHRGIKLLLLVGVVWIGALALRATNSPLYLGEGPPSLGAASRQEEGYWAALTGALPLALVVCLLLPLIAGRATTSLAGSRMRPLIMAAAIGVSLVVGIAIVCLIGDVVWMSPQHFLLHRLLETAIHAIVFIGFAAFVTLGAVLARTGWSETVGWQRQAARAAILLLAVLAGTPGAWIYWQMLKRPTFPPANHGPTNNFYRIMEIGEGTKDYLNSPVALPAKLRAEVDEAVTLLRAPNFVPVAELEDPQGMAVAGAVEWLSLPQQLSAACVEAADNGQTDQAVDYAISVVRYGTMFERGTTSGHVWVVGSVQEFGYQRLALHRAELTPAKAREIIRWLHQSLRERDDLELILYRDQVALERSGHWQPRLKNVLQKLSGSRDPPEHAAAIEESRKRSEAFNRLLQADLAIRLFRGDRGRLPESLTELAPEYLPELPIDPYSDNPLVYQAAGAQFTLYSIGPNGQDDGGRGPSLMSTTPTVPYGTGDDVHLGPPRQGN